MSETRKAAAGRQCRAARARARGRAAGAIPRRGVGRGSARAFCAASRSHAACRRERAACRGAQSRAGARRGGDGRRAAVRPLQCRWLRAARGRNRRRRRRHAENLSSQRRSDRLRRRAGARGCARHRHHDCDGWRDPARRRRGGDDRTDRVDRRRRANNEPGIELRRAAAPGQFISYAGSDIARGETLLRRGARIGSREIGMLAACGLAQVDVVRRPKVAVLSTGDELVAPGSPLDAAGVYDSNGAIIAAAVREAGGEPLELGAIADDAEALEKAVRRALKESDLVVLSGGTSKGAGDLSHPGGGAARQARHFGARRRAQARQAALSRRHRRPRRSWCCPAFRPRRSSPSTLSSRR